MSRFALRCSTQGPPLQGSLASRLCTQRPSQDSLGLPWATQGSSESLGLHRPSEASQGFTSFFQYSSGLPRAFQGFGGLWLASTSPSPCFLPRLWAF